MQYSCGRAEQAAPLPLAARLSSRLLPPETPALQNLQSMPCRVSGGTHKLRSHECSASVPGVGYRVSDTVTVPGIGVVLDFATRDRLEERRPEGPNVAPKWTIICQDSLVQYGLVQ